MFAFTAVKGQSSSFLWQILTIPFSWKHDDMWPTALKTFRSLCSTGGVRLGRNSCRRLTFSRTSTSLCSPPGVGRPGIWLKQDYARVSSKLTIHSFFNSRLILKDVWNPYYGWICSHILKAYQTFFNLINIQICSRILTYCFLSISTMCKVFWISPNLARDMSLPRTQNFKILQVPVCYRTWVYLHRHLQIPKSVAIVEASLTTGGLGKSFLWPSKQHPADLCNVFDVKIVSIKSQMS